MKNSIISKLIFIVNVLTFANFVTGKVVEKRADAECVSSYQDINVIVNPSASGREYEYYKGITVPCSGDYFKTTFDVDLVSDVYFLLASGKNSRTGIEGVIGVKSWNWSIGGQKFDYKSEFDRNELKMTVVLEVSQAGLRLTGRTDSILYTAADHPEMKEILTKKDFYLY
ncbi:hypothetical protein AYI70_g8911, partial [Smittium culicis]